MTVTRPALSPAGRAEGRQLVVARGRRPPARPRIQVDGRRRPADRVERAGVPARPEADAPADLVGEDKVEVLGAQGGPGDPLDLLQHPRADIGVGRRPRRDRRPRPGELDVGQVNVEPDQVQRPGQRHQHREHDRLAEHQGRQGQERSPFDPARDQPPSRAWHPVRAAGPQAVDLAAPRRGQRLTRDDPGIVRGVAGTLKPAARFLPVALALSAERASLLLPRPRRQHAQQQNQEAKHGGRLFCAAAWCSRDRRIVETQDDRYGPERHPEPRAGLVRRVAGDVGPPHLHVRSGQAFHGVRERHRGDTVRLE